MGSTAARSRSAARIRARLASLAVGSPRPTRHRRTAPDGSLIRSSRRSIVQRRRRVHVERVSARATCRLRSGVGHVRHRSDATPRGSVLLASSKFHGTIERLHRGPLPAERSPAATRGRASRHGGTRVANAARRQPHVERHSRLDGREPEPRAGIGPVVGAGPAGRQRWVRNRPGPGPRPRRRPGEHPAPAGPVRRERPDRRPYGGQDEGPAPGPAAALLAARRKGRAPSRARRPCTTLGATPPASSPVRPNTALARTPIDASRAPCPDGAAVRRGRLQTSAGLTPTRERCPGGSRRFSVMLSTRSEPMSPIPWARSAARRRPLRGAARSPTSHPSPGMVQVRIRSRGGPTSFAPGWILRRRCPRTSVRIRRHSAPSSTHETLGFSCSSERTGGAAGSRSLGFT